MYLGIDVGGTKTLAAILDDNGVITQKKKFPTPKNYSEFLEQIKDNINSFSEKDFRAVGIGIPVTSFDRDTGIARTFSNLPWRNEPIQADLENITKSPVAIENDAKLAGLSESMLREPLRLLYVTVSTGIGYSLIVDRKIDHEVGDSGGRLLLLEHNGRLMPWESFASGKAIVETYGKMAKDIDDDKTWELIARDIGQGLIELVAVTEPEVIVIGGSVGTYFDKYGDRLNDYLKNLETPLLPMPRVEGANRPEEAVIYGCYDYAKEVFVNSR